MPTKHFLQLKDFSRAEFEYLFERTRWIKDRFKRYEIYQPLLDRTMAMVTGISFLWMRLSKTTGTRS